MICGTPTPMIGGIVGVVCEHWALLRLEVASLLMVLAVKAAHARGDPRHRNTRPRA